MPRRAGMDSRTTCHADGIDAVIRLLLPEGPSGIPASNRDDKDVHDRAKSMWEGTRRRLDSEYWRDGQARRDLQAFRQYASTGARARGTTGRIAEGARPHSHLNGRRGQERVRRVEVRGVLNRGSQFPDQRCVDRASRAPPTLPSSS